MLYLQVSDEITVEHGVRALHDLAVEQGPKAFSEQQLKIAVHLAQNVADLLAQGSTLKLQVLTS